MKKLYIISALVMLAVGCASPKDITVNSGEFSREDCIVKVNVGKAGDNFALVETTNGTQTPVASQIIKEDGVNWLYFKMEGTTPAGQSRTYTYAPAEGKTGTGTKMNVVDNGNDLILKSGNNDIMSYNYTLSEVPEGVRKVFARSGYIHPAHTPSGFVYTNVQPVDHRHHYGIWNPWTRVQFEDKVYDLWNLGDSLGTVRAKNIEAVYQGDVVAGFNAVLEHVAFTPEGEKVIMNETWKIKAVDAGYGYLWDFVSELEAATESPVTIKAYRYQGFSCRATAEWTRENSVMMTSEGLERPQIDGSTARWIYVNGAAGDGMAGFMFMATPENYNSPEPLRIWDQNANWGRGDVYVNFCPTKTVDWVLEPGQKYQLSYRVMAYDGEMDPQKAEALWTDFVYPPTVTIK